MDQYHVHVNENEDIWIEYIFDDIKRCIEYINLIVRLGKPLSYIRVFKSTPDGKMTRIHFTTAI